MPSLEDSNLNSNSKSNLSDVSALVSTQQALYLFLEADDIEKTQLTHQKYEFDNIKSVLNSFVKNLYCLGNWYSRWTNH